MEQGPGRTFAQREGKEADTKDAQGRENSLKKGKQKSLAEHEQKWQNMMMSFTEKKSGNYWLKKGQVKKVKVVREKNPDRDFKNKKSSPPG